MARAPKVAAATIDTAPEEGAAVEAVVQTQVEIMEQTMSETAEAVAVVEFAGASIPADSLFVAPVERHLELNYNDTPCVFWFRAGEPRQLPAGVILEALGMGIQVAN